MTEIRPGRFQVLPTIIKNLIIINVIMVLLQLSLYATFKIDIGEYLALHYWRSAAFRPWQLVTHMFLHGSADPRMLQETIAHIFFNMFGLWMIGSVLENMWGPRRFLLFYIICGVGAALCQLGVLAIQFEPVVKAFGDYQQHLSPDTFSAFATKHLSGKIDGFTAERLNDFYGRWMSNPNSIALRDESGQLLRESLYGVRLDGIFHPGRLDEAMVGASGAIFGVLFAFGYLFPNTLLYFYFFVPIKAKYFVALYAALELFLGLRFSASDNVAHFAHLGGMLFGFVILKLWSRQLRNRSF